LTFFSWHSHQPFEIKGEVKYYNLYFIEEESKSQKGAQRHPGSPLPDVILRTIRGAQQPTDPEGRPDGGGAPSISITRDTQ
jgi:hypothetical protein